jgi:2-hydroxy-3-keto-5-methylthiopentenyl-1-phosphate phosphatase
MKTPKVAAIVYDFDGTLASGNCVEHGLLESLGIKSSDDFWKEVKERTKREDADQILTYMQIVAEKAMQKQQTLLSPEKLQEFGRSIPLFDGLDTWFERINAFAIKKDLILEHYVVSSGLKEMIRGCKIGPKIKHIYACQFMKVNGGGYCPSVAINYTTKTQYLFRINKGIHNNWDDESINRWMADDERPMPFERMIYLGDGDTDIPSMKMVTYKGGQSIAVFDPSEWEQQKNKDKISRLIAEKRVNFVAPGDFSEGELLDILIRGIIGRYARDVGYKGKTNKSVAFNSVTRSTP